MSTLVADGEINEKRIMQRAKQVQYGKNTPGYQHYIACVPKEQRDRYHPQTPRIHQKCSKRSWDGQLAKWRRELHKWDPHPRECPPREPKEKPPRKERYQNRRQQQQQQQTATHMKPMDHSENPFLERATMSHTPTQFQQTCGKSDGMSYSGGGSIQSIDSTAYSTNVYHAPGSQYHQPSVAKPIVMPPAPHQTTHIPNAPQRVVPLPPRPTPLQMPVPTSMNQTSCSTSTPSSAPSPHSSAQTSTNASSISCMSVPRTPCDSEPTTPTTPDTALSSTSSCSSFPGIYIKKKPKRPATPSQPTNADTTTSTATATA